MENTVNKHDTSPPKNLHPLWYRHFGIQASATPNAMHKPRNAGEVLIQAVQKLAAARPIPR